MFAILLAVVFAFGVAAERQFFRQEKAVELFLKFDRQSGFVTAYTFYRDRDGREVKHGEFHEFDVAGRMSVRRKYEDGRVVGGVGTFN